MRRRLWAGAFLAVGWLCAGGPALAQTTSASFGAVQDTSIFNGTPGSDTLADGSGDFLWLSVTAEGLNRRMLVKFDVSSIPPGSVVQQVTVTLYESRARDEHNVAVHRLLASWGEGASSAGGQGTGAPAQPGDATWVRRFFPNTPWANPGGDFDPVASDVRSVGFPNTTYSWGGNLPQGGGPAPRIVSDVQAWVDNPGSNHGWIFIGAEDGLQNAKRFESRNNATVATRPKLTVVWAKANPPVDDADIPVPGWALGVLAATLLGVHAVHSGRSRRRE
ncbi:MAG: DNRLRE domain-containing protein [Chitinophagaceae bacterium]|nr:DNRLRE domain-containing protein [Rubrivivax sp.]